MIAIILFCAALEAFYWSWFSSCFQLTYLGVGTAPAHPRMNGSVPQWWCTSVTVKSLQCLPQKRNCKMNLLLAANNIQFRVTSLVEVTYDADEDTYEVHTADVKPASEDSASWLEHQSVWLCLDSLNFEFAWSSDIRNPRGAVYCIGFPRFAAHRSQLLVLLWCHEFAPPF